METVNILIPRPEQREISYAQTGECCTFTCVRADQPDVVVDVLVYEGGASKDSYYFEGRGDANAQLVLYGGEPPAYQTVCTWPNGPGAIYEFGYDDTNELFEKHYAMVHLAIVIPRVACREISFLEQSENKQKGVVTRSTVNTDLVQEVGCDRMAITIGKCDTRRESPNAQRS